MADKCRAGTGIGLPISKNIIEGMGGTLAVASQYGVGTEFRIELPLARPLEPVLVPSSETSDTVARKS